MKPRHIIFSIIITLCLAFLVIIISKMVALHDKGFTELYFTNPNELPGTAIPDQNLSILFTVHNRWGQANHYNYSVSFQAGTGEPEELHKRFSLGARERRGFNVTLNPDVDFKYGKINVGVYSENEQLDIHFHVMRGEVI